MYAGQLLGYPEEGCEDEEQLLHRDLIVDFMGPQCPADTQMMLSIAIITADLVWYDQAVLDQALSNARAGAAKGKMPTAGVFLGAGGFLKSLYIPSSLDGTPKTYAATHLIGPVRARRGTVRSMKTVVFRALPYTNGLDNSSGAVLYS